MVTQIANIPNILHSLATLARPTLTALQHESAKVDLEAMSNGALSKAFRELSLESLHILPIE